VRTSVNSGESQKYKSGRARDQFSIFRSVQTQHFEDFPINLLFFKRFSKFGGPVPTRPLFWLRYCRLRFVHLYLIITITNNNSNQLFSFLLLLLLLLNQNIDQTLITTIVLSPQSLQLELLAIIG
jgi:hypothetical protein